MRYSNRLRGVHPMLVDFFYALDVDPRLPFEFGISSGVRSEKRQRELVAQKKSWTTESLHLSVDMCWDGRLVEFGRAVDYYLIVDGKVSWDNNGHNSPYGLFVDFMRVKAKELGLDLVFGHDWKQVDSVHVELDRRVYRALEKGKVCEPVLPDEALDRNPQKEEKQTEDVAMSVSSVPVEEAVLQSQEPIQTQQTEESETVMNDYDTKPALASKGVWGILIAVVGLLFQKFGLDPESAGTVVDIVVQLLVALGLGGGLFGRIVATEKIEGIL